MLIALMKYDGTHHATVEWSGEYTDKEKCYLKLPGDYNNFTAALAIRPEDVKDYVAHCHDIEKQILFLQNELCAFKVIMHRRLIPLNK